MISLFFMKSSYGEHFFNLPEFKDLGLIFSNSALGFKLESPADQVSKMMDSLPHTSKLSRFITFMEILRLMGQGEITTLSSALHTKIYGEEEGKRMSHIFSFTLDHFDKSISLKEVAEIANMTPNAFCSISLKQ